MSIDSYMVSVNTEANAKCFLERFYGKKKGSYRYKTQII